MSRPPSDSGIVRWATYLKLVLKPLHNWHGYEEGWKPCMEWVKYKCSAKSLYATSICTGATAKPAIFSSRKHQPCIVHRHLVTASFAWWHPSQVTSLADTWPWSSHRGGERTKRNTHLPVASAATASIPTSSCNQAKSTLEWVQATGSGQQAGGFYHLSRPTLALMKCMKTIHYTGLRWYSYYNYCRQHYPLQWWTLKTGSSRCTECVLIQGDQPYKQPLHNGLPLVRVSDRQQICSSIIILSKLRP